MATQDTCCTIVPYFRIREGMIGSFRGLCEQFLAKAMEEEGCLYYGFSFNGDQAHCREGYANAEAALAHLDHVGPLMAEVLNLADIARFEIHGPETELAKLRGPLEAIGADFFTLEYGFRR